MKPEPARPVGLPPPSLRHPGRWLWLLLLVPILLGLARLRFDVEVFDLLPSDLRPVQGLKLYQEHFANARELIVSIRAPSAEAAETAARSIAERLRPATNLVASVTWEPPWLEHPDQAAELIAYLWLNQPPSVFAELTNRLARDKLDDSLKATREELATSLSPETIARSSYDPFGFTRLPESASGAAPSFAQGQEMFSSVDGTFRILFIQSQLDLRTYHDCAGWLAHIKQLATGAMASRQELSNVRLGYTGRPAFYSEVALGMQRDITGSVGGTAIIIAVLFWIAHRRVKPMLWLLALLAVILGSTLALGGLIFGTINVVSMGFAAILLGLAVDYAVVHYQEALAHPNLSIPQIRHAIAPSILWAAVTTIAAFLVLNFGGLPGLGQLGSLVGLGVALAALIMIFEFLPPLFPGRNAPTLAASARSNDELDDSHQPRVNHVPPFRMWGAFGITIFLVLITSGILLLGLPPINPTANALRPRNSQAYTTLDEIQSELNRKADPLWLIIRGSDLAEVGNRLEQVQAALANAVSNQWFAGFTLPTLLWPHPAFQQANRVVAGQLAEQRDVFRNAARSNGFAAASTALADRVLDTWAQAAGTSGVFWPTNPMSRWILEKVTAHTGTNYFALGLLNQTPNGGATHNLSHLAGLESQLPSQGVWLSGWQLLGNAIFSRVQANMWKVLGPMVVLVLLSLYFAFRRPPEILLSLAVLLLSGLCLLSVMRVVGWKWNLLNLMAIPLVLGTGVDYSIFMQLALRRYSGNLDLAYRSVGRALLLCGGTAIAGFGSLAWSSNAGMASLGQVCAVGIGSNMLIAIYLLPLWWHRAVAPLRCVEGRRASAAAPTTRSPVEIPAPSSLYCSTLWRLGICAVRLLPLSIATRLSSIAATVYWALARHRREVVIANLLPVLSGDLRAARAQAKALFGQFALKLLDLWRFEAGLPFQPLLRRTTGWEHFVAANQQNRGVLLVTPHLGNWEFGGPLMTQRGVQLQVLTSAEPGTGFTEMRRASRAKWNIETLVVGSDPMAFVEVIKRLENGATVALLVDRPPAPTGVSIELFGQPFLASIAAAELARASGCALVPVYLPRNGSGYDAHILPAVPYDRAALRDRETRRRLTQTIMATFEPLIRAHADQWYHFVPVWLNWSEDAQSKRGQAIPRPEEAMPTPP